MKRSYLKANKQKENLSELQAETVSLFKMNFLSKTTTPQHKTRTGMRVSMNDGPRRSVVSPCKVALRHDRVGNTRRQWRVLETLWAFFFFVTFAGNFQADYFPALTDGAIKRSWVRNLEKFQGCLCFPSSWTSLFVSLRLSTWKYGTQFKTTGWRPLERWLELSFEQLLANSIGSTSGQSRFGRVFVRVKV